MASRSHLHLPVKYIESLLTLARDLPKEPPPKTPKSRPPPPPSPATAQTNNTNQQ